MPAVDERDGNVTTDERLLRDLVDLPESVQKADFVVSLANGITDPASTLGKYVVTPDLVTCFDQALGLVASTVKDNTSKGAYLHGSFGSGKSHFMAVLHLLLSGDAEARSITRLGPTIAKYDATLRDTNILMIPYHMVGKDTMESGVLGGYVDHIRTLHPDAPLPAVFASQKIFHDADRMRSTIGDEAFFDGLGGGSDDLAGFGDLGGGWDADGYARAKAAPADDEDRKRLTADLIGAYFSSYADLAEGAGGGYVPFDQGLAAISRHARDLGYDALLLFLDELILWLASRMSDEDFVSREGAKVALLVEGSAPRPIPIASFIARQRDLKDFIGEGVSGAERASFGHGLEWWSGRFSTITLADSNLPAIVEERLLKPKSDSARAEIDQAFEAFTNRADRALDTLMTTEADKKAFRQSYPFSPALINVLVGVSAFLQRERTSLKLLSEILSERRDTLTIGQIVPLGELWDHISEADEPLDGALRRHFTKARHLYTTRLRPMVLDDHGLTEETIADVDPQHAVHGDLRLVETLLLAALVPDVPAVKGLTVGRLTDLNHGSIRSPIPGGERSNVLNKVRKWSARVGELRVDGDSQDPSVSLQLVSVDVESIIQQASEMDTTGSRVRMVRTLLTDALGLSDSDALLGVSHKHLWRGRQRIIDLTFANIRDAAELPDSGFRADVTRPKVVIDYPFDTAYKGPMDDVARVRELGQKIGAQPTLCWIPRTLTSRSKKDLGTLVILDYLLTGDRLQNYTNHLAVLQRTEAREVLAARRDQLRAQVRDVIRMAYGVTSPDWTLVKDDIPNDEQFIAVDPAIDVRPPTAATLTGAFEGLLDQLWRMIAPDHPKFPDEVRKADLVRTLELVQEAAGSPDRRVDVPTADRRLLTRVIEPLQLGKVGEAHFVLDREWRDHFNNEHAADPGPRTVERLREWSDTPRPRLLDDQVLALVIASYAVDDDLVMVLDGMTIPPSIGTLAPRTELVQVELPTEDEWQTATRRAAEIFGVQASPVRSASNVAQLANNIRTVAKEHREDARRLVEQMNALADAYDIAVDASRRATAAAGRDLLDGVVSAAKDIEVVRFLAAASVPTSAAALGASIKQSGRVATAIASANLALFNNAFALTDERASDAGVIRDRLIRDTERDQLATDLVDTLTEVNRDVTALFRPTPTATPPTPPSPPVPHTPRTREERVALAETSTLLARLEREGVTEVTVRWEEP